MYSKGVSLINDKIPLYRSIIRNEFIINNLFFFNERCFSSIKIKKYGQYYLNSSFINKYNYTNNILKKRLLLNSHSEKHIHSSKSSNRYDNRTCFAKYDYIKNNIFLNKLYKIRNVRLGYTLVVTAIILYLLSLINHYKIKIYDNGFINTGEFNKNNTSSSNIVVKYIINIFNDPKLEESLKNLVKKILISTIKECNDESLVNWKLLLKSTINEFENEFGNGIANILKTKAIQEWIYSTVNEVMDYLSKTPEIVSKTSSLFSEAINHKIFTEDSKKWFDEFVKSYIVNNKEILHSFNQLLVNLFNTKETQNNINNIFYQYLSNRNTKEYLNIAIWDVFKNYIFYPKYWFTGVNKQRIESIKNDEKGQQSK
ncbi:hypothetical protein FG379_002213 [Cryptosporidium bovis]|uniref:uncharacterized protein n=1 Tax=Cryptosporidium bovis TaxID=310047 RepID=UPI00351A3D56|nr:hypothetical protein FG379_002213 [Cryptosporidium bovis]